MGFDPLDKASMISPQLPLTLLGGQTLQRDDGPLFASVALGPQPGLRARACPLTADIGRTSLSGLRL